MKKEFSRNATEVFTKTTFHYIPEILKYIDEIEEPRKKYEYSMRYLFFSEMLMFLSEGKSQRFTETAYKDTNYLENISKIIGEKVEKIPDAEIYTNVFSKVKKEELREFQYKIMKHIFRNKFFSQSKVMGRYNCVMDATRFQKGNCEISKDWLSQTKNGETTWYLAMLDIKIVANGAAISLMNEMINNEDKKLPGETEKDVEKKSEEKIKQDCELNASKRILPEIRKYYPRLPIRIIADSLYPSEELIELCEKLKLEYIFVLKDKKIPTLLEEFLTLVSLPEGERMLVEQKEKTILILWENDIEYRGKKVNIIRQITRDKRKNEESVWMWITNRRVTERNVLKIISCAKCRDYIENQGFREQKITSGIDLEHVYSKNIKAINVIYTIIQLTHMILQIIEHSDICGNFKEKYGSVKVFNRKFYAHITERKIDIKIIQIKIQIRFDVSLMIN